MSDPFDPEDDADYQSSLEAARSSGYSWNDIWSHLTGATAAAAQVGYTQPEIDQHLGFKDPAGFEAGAKASWATTMASDPAVLDDMAAGKVDLTANPAVRSEYVDALKAGEVKGPLDFSERYGAAAVGAAHDVHGLDDADGDAHLAAASAAAAGLATALPTREDLADATVALDPLNRLDKTGMVAPGNLDPIQNRPVLHNPDGSYSTTSSISIGTDKGETIIPTVVNGKRLTEDEAVDYFHKTGENFGTFATVDDAERYSQDLHNAQASHYDVRGNLLDHWAETGQQPVDAANQALSGDAELATKLMQEEFADPLGPAIRGMVKAGAGTIFQLEHIGEQAFKTLADVTGSEGLGTLVLDKAAEWKAREEEWNKALASSTDTAPANFVSGILGQTIPTVAEYLVAGVPAMITLGILHGANAAYQETGSAAAAAAGGIIGGAEAGAPVPFLHGLVGGNLIDGAVRGALGMGLIGGLQTFAEPVPRAIATGDYTAPTWEGVEQGVVSGAIGGALFGAFGASRNLRAVVIDPSKPPGETNTEMTARQALKPIEPAAMEVPVEGGEPKFSPDSTPAERIVRIMTDEPGLSADKLSSGTFFQDKLAAMGETDPATVELAKGHDTAWAGLRYLRGLAGDLLSDTQGSVPRELTQGEKEELARQQEAMKRPSEPKELPANAPRAQPEQKEPTPPPPENTRNNTNLMRDAIIKFASRGEQNILHFSGLVDSVRHLLNPHMPEFEAALADPNGAPMDTTIGHMLRDMEGRGEVTVPGSGGKRFFAMLDPNHPLSPVVDMFKTINTHLWSEIQDRVARGDINSVGYVHDYWRHLWEDPNQAEAAWGAGRQGSNASLKERTIPTIADGLAMGLKLKIPHPADLINYDVASKIKYLQHLDLVDHLENKSGLIVRSIRAPFPGAEQLQGRSMERVTPDGVERAWAPQGAARLYNRTIESGWYAYPATASTYQKLMWLKNTSVSTKLIFPVFHSFVIAEQTLATGFQQMASEVAAGNIGAAALHAAKTVTVVPKALEIARAGRKVIADYAKQVDDPILNGLVDAGGRYGKRQFQYQMSAQGIGASMMQNKGHLLEAAGREITREAKATLGQEGEHILERGAMFVPRVAGMAINELGRVQTTLSAPLFDYAIPTMKAGVSYLRAKQFLDLNPQSSEATRDTRLRQIVENVEDRFGEMNQDNLLWNKWLKQTANAGSISTSWAYGTWRWLAGASGYNLERGVEWNPEATGSLVGAVAVYTGANALFNYLNTGERPKDIWDLLNFRTGGTTKSGAPQRGLLPTEFKELYDMGRIAVDAYLDPMSVFKGIAHYIAGKENPFVQLLDALVTGEDAVGHKISQQPGGWGKYFIDQVKPIVWTNLEKNPVGGGLNKVEQTFINAAPSWLTDTQAYVKQQQALHDRWTKEELQRAGREAVANGQEPPEGYKPPSGRGGARTQGRGERQLFLIQEREAAAARAGANADARNTRGNQQSGVVNRGAAPQSTVQIGPSGEAVVPEVLGRRGQQGRATRGVPAQTQTLAGETILRGNERQSPTLETNRPAPRSAPRPSAPYRRRRQ